MTLPRSDTPIVCRTFEGLCNRINALASALVTGRPVHLYWAVNIHCPAHFEELFDPIFGVKVVNQRVPAYRYATSPEEICWFYPKNVEGIPFNQFRARLHRAYRQILKHLLVDVAAMPLAPALGLHFRHYCTEVGEFSSFQRFVERAVECLRPRTVHIATDSEDFKSRLRDQLKSLGVKSTSNHCPLLTRDLDRTVQQVRGMSDDLWSLQQCELGVIANSTRSTVVDSLRGVDVQTYYTYDDGFHRYEGRDDLFEMQPIEQLLYRARLEAKD